MPKKSGGPICPPLKVISIRSAGESGALTRQSGAPRVSSPIISIDSIPSAAAICPEVSPPATMTRRDFDFNEALLNGVTNLSPGDGRAAAADRDDRVTWLHRLELRFWKAPMCYKR